MIVTITFNPSLDYIIYVPAFETGRINRTDAEKILPGGKGINVSSVLSSFGHQTIALGFAAGNTGRMLRAELMSRGIEADLIEAESGFTRINVKMLGTQETQINGRGPQISQTNMEQLCQRLSRLSPADFLVVSGSVPACLGTRTYARIAELVSRSGCRLVVDAEGGLLTETLPYHPFLIKPNQAELEMAAGRKLDGMDEIIDAAADLKKQGAQNVLVSLGERGAVLLCGENDVFVCRAPHVDAVNTVGSGDSAVAGFISGFMETGSFARALMKAVAAGSASAAGEELADREATERLLRTIHIEQK